MHSWQCITTNTKRKRSTDPPQNPPVLSGVAPPAAGETNAIIPVPKLVVSDRLDGGTRSNTPRTALRLKEQKETRPP